MKCIYCNSESGLTSSDIISYAITGAKLAKPFVCNVHNAFTNNQYEKKFISNLDIFRNHLGLSTREGNPIQYIADIIINDETLHSVKLSNKESFFSPKNVVVGYDDSRNKTLIAPIEKLNKINNVKINSVDVNNITVHKTISLDSFLDFYAIHSIAKMAYEWYCYTNNIEEFKDEYKEIVDYILGKNNNKLVDIITDEEHYMAIDQLSEIGTNSFFQYDDFDGYRYVVFDFWKIVSYRIKICKSPNKLNKNSFAMSFELFLYNIDGSKTQKHFSLFLLGDNRNNIFNTIMPEELNDNLGKQFINRIKNVLSNMVLSIHILKQEIDVLFSKLKEYNEGIIDLLQLLNYEETRTIATLEIITHLYQNKDSYDKSKTLSQNLSKFLNLNNNTIIINNEERKSFITNLAELDKNKKLYDFILKEIEFFYSIYENEIKSY